MRANIKKGQKSGNEQPDKTEMVDDPNNPNQEENKEENLPCKPTRRRIAKKKPYSPGSFSELKSNIPAFTRANDEK